MSLLDIRHAKEALAWRLKEWGVTEDYVALAASFIDDLVEKGWRMDANRELRAAIPKVHEACRQCGGFRDRCDCRPEMDHHADAAFDASLARAQLRLAQAGCCAHGVRAETCVEHRTLAEEAGDE